MSSHNRKRRKQQQKASSKNPLPHILLLMTDQFRHDALDALVTPNLYQWATNSKTTLFQNAYSSTPTCTPARAALLTGKSPWHHGLLGYAPAVDCEDYPTTLPSILANLLNYQTVVVGKNHFGTKPCKDKEKQHQSANKEKFHTAKDCRASDEDNAQKRRFVNHGYQNMTLYDGLNAIPDDYDEFFQDQLPGINPMATCGLGWNDWRGCPYIFDEDLHPTAWTTRTALQTLDKYMAPSTQRRNNHTTNVGSSSITNHRPVFLKVSYHRPHSPYDPPKRLFDKHLARSRLSNQTANTYTRNLGNHNTSWDTIYASRDNQDDNVMPPNAWHGDPGESKARKSRAAYLANAEFVDEGVGALFQKLQTLGLWDQTLVIWVSDHGDMNGDHYLWRKGYPWEASSRINVVVKLPEQQVEKSSAAPATTTSDALVELRDVAPTIYDVLGILDVVTTFLDPMIDGKSLLPILTNKTSFVRSSLDLEHSTLYDKSIHWNAIVAKRYTPDQEEEQSLSQYSTMNRRTNARNSTNNSLFHSDGKDWDCTLAKYIFFASTGQEQFFCLSNDPHEVNDLASDPDYASLLAVWRAKLVQQFQTEGRGEHWVTMDGKLVARPEGRVYGPHYPCRQASKKNNEFETNSIGRVARVDE